MSVPLKISGGARAVLSVGRASGRFEAMVRGAMHALRCLALIAFLVPACGDAQSMAANECPPGSEGCDCYGNGTCDAGLACRSGLCVDAGDGDVGGGDAGSASGGVSGDKGGASGSGADRGVSG